MGATLWDQVTTPPTRRRLASRSSSLRPISNAGLSSAFVTSGRPWRSGPRGTVDLSAQPPAYFKVATSRLESVIGSKAHPQKKRHVGVVCMLSEAVPRASIMGAKATGAHLQWLRFLEANGPARGDNFANKVKGTFA